MHIRALTAMLLLLFVAATGCGWQPYPHAPAGPSSAGHAGQCGGKPATIQCLMGQIRPTTTPAELHRIFRRLDRLGVNCTGTLGSISCTGPGAGEGWEVFGPTPPVSGL